MWQSIKRIKTKLPMPRNAFVAKIMFDKLPVGDRLNFFDPTELALCRCCNVQVETQKHLYQCRNRRCKSYRLRCWIKQCKAILIAGHTSRLLMDAIDNNVRDFLLLPQRPQPWQRSQGHRAVHAAVQRAIVAQHRIGWDKFLFGFVSPAWESAQSLYQEITGDYPPRPPPAWVDILLPALWDFSHDIWSYRNEVNHGVTALEQAAQARARVVALVTDRYRHRPHLAPRYNFLYKKSL